MAAQMGLFETTESEVPFVAPSTVDEPDPSVKAEAEFKSKQPEPKPVEPPRSTTPRDQPDASPNQITEKSLGEPRLSTRRIWGATAQGAYQQTIETVYYVVSANETSRGLSQDALPVAHARAVSGGSSPTSTTCITGAVCVATLRGTTSTS